MVIKYYSNELYHHGILGQKWGVRRYQNEDGTLTPEGRERYGLNKTLPKVKRPDTKYEFIKISDKENTNFVRKTENDNNNKKKESLYFMPDKDFQKALEYGDKYAYSIWAANSSATVDEVKEVYKSLSKSDKEYIDDLLLNYANAYYDKLFDYTDKKYDELGDDADWYDDSDLYDEDD